jgi:hypothetical protein
MAIVHNVLRSIDRADFFRKLAVEAGNVDKDKGGKKKR